MIITRTPLRISIGGGGTDLPSYYRRAGGFVISAAITKYVFIGINRTFSDDFLLKYSQLERVRSRAEVDHPIIREALELMQVDPPAEIVSLADIPAGTGLGSSGSFTVGLLRALVAYTRGHMGRAAVAEAASAIEIDRLGRPVGKQDQYIASFGGVMCFDFNPDDTVDVAPLALSDAAHDDLEENLLMFFTGFSRQASDVLEEQKARSQSGDERMLANLDAVKEMGLRIRGLLESGDTESFGLLMHEHWMRKRERSRSMTNEAIDRWYDAGLRNGAVGGKLVGAGNGGFLMFYARDRDRLRDAMAREGLGELRFRFDHDGSRVIVRD